MIEHTFMILWMSTLRWWYINVIWLIQKDVEIALYTMNNIVAIRKDPVKRIRAAFILISFQYLRTMTWKPQGTCRIYWVCDHLSMPFKKMWVSRAIRLCCSSWEHIWKWTCNRVHIQLWCQWSNAAGGGESWESGNKKWLIQICLKYMSDAPIKNMLQSVIKPQANN